METNNKETVQEQPNKEQVLVWMKEQIDFKTVQLEMQELDTKIALSKFQQMEALYKISMLTSTEEEATTAAAKEHIITEEDMEAHPHLTEMGYKVGDVYTGAKKQTTKPSNVKTLKRDK
jgi:hypothetical protein